MQKQASGADDVEIQLVLVLAARGECADDGELNDKGGRIVQDGWPLGMRWEWDGLAVVANQKAAPSVAFRHQLTVPRGGHVRA